MSRYANRQYAAPHSYDWDDMRIAALSLVTKSPLSLMHRIARVEPSWAEPGKCPLVFCKITFKAFGSFISSFVHSQLSFSFSYNTLVERETNDGNDKSVIASGDLGKRNEIKGRVSQVWSENTRAKKKSCNQSSSSRSSSSMVKQQQGKKRATRPPIDFIVVNIDTFRLMRCFNHYIFFPYISPKFLVYCN